MDVVLIDSGIWSDGGLKNKIAGKVEFVSTEEVKEGCDYMPSHGTICAWIISSICPEVQFWDLKIMNQDGKTQISILLKALDWCIQKKMKLIHMSLGTIDYFDIAPLETSIRKLTDQGAMIVAAYHNSNIKTYPAAFPRVFGVRQDDYGVLGENQFMIQKQQGFHLENSIIAHWWGESRENRANSYAAPVITGRIANFLNKTPAAGFHEVLDYLEKNASKEKEYPDIIEHVIKKDKGVEIPVIAAVRLHRKGIEILAEGFSKNGYEVLILTENHVDSMSIPFEYYSGKDISLTNILYTVNAVYKPDLILLDFALGERYDTAKMEEIDVSIVYENEVYKIYAENLTKAAKKPAGIYDIIYNYYK